MDYLIEVRTWSLGFDEAEELASAIAELLVERRLGLRAENDEEELIRSIVSLKPQGGRLDAGVPEKAERVIGRAAEGAQMLIVPSRRGSLVERPGVGGRA